MAPARAGMHAQWTGDREPPVIDLSRGDDEALVREVRDACELWGFFQVVGHGCNQRVIREFDEAMVAFFNLPDAVKRSVKRQRDNPRGYFDDELTKRTLDHKEGFDMGAEGDFEVDGHNQWPAGHANFRVKTLAYYEMLEVLAIRLMRVIARGLGLPADAFDMDLLPRNTSFMRLNRYPVAPPGKRGVGEDWPDKEPKGGACGVLFCCCLMLLRRRLRRLLLSVLLRLQPRLRRLFCRSCCLQS
jgi:isopenicillin N synthase-like dioxygenase